MRNMTEAFEIYFKKLLSAWKAKFGTLPKVCYEEELSELLIVGLPSDDEMVQWQPKKI